MRQAAQAQAQQATTQTTQSEDGSIQVQTTAPAPAAYDASQEQSLLAQIAALNAQLAERRQAWAPTLHQAAEQSAQAQAQVGRLTRLLKESQQVSPASGVVTELYAKAGSSVVGGQKLVRIDNPAGYRVVATVDQNARERIDPGGYLRLKLPSGSTTGTVEKIASGVDKKLFDYEVWVKPDADVKLQPGEKIQVMVPKPTETAMIR
jgi:multidrug resistance efflux pump